MHATPPPRFSASRDGNTVRIAGEFDAKAAGPFEEILEHVTSRLVHLDLAGVTFVDSSGFRALIRAIQRFEDNGRTLTITSLSPAVQRLLDLVGMDVGELRWTNRTSTDDRPRR
jgi:anti-anti-sigma factor